MDWYKKDSLEETYVACFINKKVSLVSVTGKAGKKSSGYATYFIENLSIFRKDENGKKIHNLNSMIKNLRRCCQNQCPCKDIMNAPDDKHASRPKEKENLWLFALPAASPNS